MTRRFSPLILGLQFLIDILLTLLAVKGAEQVRLHLSTGLERRGPTAQAFAIEPGVYVLIVAVWVCLFILLGAFDSQRHDSQLVDLSNLWLSVTVSMLVLASAFYLLALEPPVAPSRLFYLYFYLLDFMLLAAAHIFTRWTLSKLRLRGRYIRRALLVGYGVQGRHVAVRLRDQDAAGVALIGYVSPSADQTIAELRRFGDLSDVHSMVLTHQIDEVVIALPATDHQETLRLNAELQDLNVNVRVLLDVFEMVAMRARVEDFHGLPLVSLREPSMNPLQAGIKRAFDLVVAGVLCLLTFPLMLAVALWIRLDSPGPVLIHQPRVGAGGAIFYMHKFRSMRAASGHGAAPGDKLPNDPRVTRAGRVLRRTSLDELPQLWNVLRGEMSLVGPRPELPVIVEGYEPWQRKRFNVPPGITGWWQVNGRSERAMHLNTELDLFYVQNYSILLDVQILLRTIGAVIRGRGAF